MREIKIQKKGQKIRWNISTGDETLDLQGRIKEIGGNHIVIKGKINIVFGKRDTFTFVKGKGITQINSPNILSLGTKN